MRLSKKILTIALVLALSLSTAAVAFADEATVAVERAEVLYELGLFLGVDTEVFTPNLEGATDRAAAMVMIARALDWMNAEDWDEDAVSGFTDVPSWAEPAVAYAVENDITVGIGEGLFGNDMDVTERHLQTWFDRALGKGDTWVDNEDLDNVTALIRADLVNGTWDALMEVPVGGEETLIETIVGDDADMMYTAMVGGIMEPLDVEIDPDDYEVTVDETAMGYYLGGDTMEVTLRGLEPLTEQNVSVLIHHSLGGFPYYRPIFEGFEDEQVVTGIVAPDGSFTFSGVLKEDMPEGRIVLIPAGYGYSIDETLGITFGEDHEVVYGDGDVGPEPQTVTLNYGEVLALEVGEEFDLTTVLSVHDQYNQVFPGEMEATWSSSDPEVASVDEDTGVVTAEAEGEAIITFDIADGPEGTVEVEVTAAE